MSAAELSRPPPEFLAGGGELGALMRAHEWSATPLGPPERWPQSLKTAVRIMLTSRQPMWLGWGEELIFLYNDPYRSIIGGKHPWALGLPTREVWSEIWDDIEPLLATALRGVEGTYVEEQLLVMERHGYPEETYYTFSYSPVPDDDGQPGGIICANTDDTQRVIGQRRLAVLRDLAADTADCRSPREAAERSGRSLARDLRDIPWALIYLVEPETGDFVLTGASGVRPDHPAAPDRLPPDAASPWPLAEALRAHAPQWVEGLALRFSGGPAGAWDTPPDRAAVLPIRPAGEATEAGVMVAALTPMRPVDDEYRGFLDLLTGQIAAAIGNAGAREAEHRRAEALAELDRAKTIFFSNVSHEFRTPLTLMLGPIEDLLNREDLEPAAAALADTAHRNGRRLLKLVNALLDFSRIEAGRAQANYEPTDLAAFTADLASSFRSATDRAGLALTIDAPPLPAPVHLDRDMWEKVVLNLMSNAFKFTLQGGITVRVRAGAGGGQVSVSDTGVGVPAEELPHLFERFHRVEGSGGRTMEGSGIGLALVHELVKLHGGKVEVQSRLGEGTTFTVTVPFGVAHLPASRVQAADAEAAAGHGVQAYLDEALRWLPEETRPPSAANAGEDAEDGDLPLPPGSRVLLADDNADMREYIGRLLRSRGYTVQAVADGRQALEAARKAPPDLVLSDVMMPGMDGFGLLAALRAEPALQHAPIILLSARAGEEARVEGLSAGADDYLVKPFSARELLARIGAALQLARMRREARQALVEEARILRESEELLERKVEERTAALAAANLQLLSQIQERERVEETLRQMQRLEAVGQLTSGVAHDFNNLLTVIVGSIDSLERGETDERRQRRLGLAREAAQRGAKLTAQLLAFSRRQRLEPKGLNLNETVQAMHDLLQSTLGGQVRLQVNLERDLWPALVDPTQIELVILNLAINARDAMPVGGSLVIETANVQLRRGAGRPEEPDPGEYVAISVCDDGEGMTPEVAAKAFEPFFTTKPVGKGSGLGLAQVFGFAKQSGGGVALETGPGQGTCVRVYLPRAAEQATAEPVSESVAPSPAPGRVVLLVDDDPAVREVEADCLRSAGYRVVEAASGADALELLAHRADIEAAVIDFAMPGMNGAEAARRAAALRPDLPILFVTGFGDLNLLGEVGEARIVQKPFRPDDLTHKIERLLAGEGV